MAISQLYLKKLYLGSEFMDKDLSFNICWMCEKE